MRTYWIIAMAAAIHLGYTNLQGESSAPHDWQNEFHGSPAKLRWLEGAVQSGKTTSAVLEGRIHSWETSNNLGLVCRETMPLLKDTVLREWLEQIDERVEFRKGEMAMYYPNGSVVLFRGLISSSGKRQARKFGSYKLGWLHIEEGDVLRQDELLLLMARLNLGHALRHQAWISMNPVNPAHWITKFRQKQGVNQAEFFSDTYGNRDNLPEGFIEDLEAFYGAEWAARYLRGESVFIGEGPSVFPTYSREVHSPVNATHLLTDEEEREFYIDEEGRDRWRHLLHERAVLRGWDFGFHRPGVVWAQKDTSDRLMCQHEFLGEMLTTDELAQVILYQSGQRKVGESSQRVQRVVHTRQLKVLYPPETRFEDYCDPAGKGKAPQTGKSDIDVLKSYDIHPHARQSLISEGVGIIRHLLSVRNDGTPGIYIDKDGCPILATAFAGGYKRKTRGDIILEEPDKDGYYDHLVDGLRYITIHTHEPFGEGRSKKRKGQIIQSTLIGGVKV